MFEIIKAVYKNDPAAKPGEFIIYPHLHAIFVHKYISRPLYLLKIPFIPRFISQVMKLFTGIEIHPGAKIGKALFIDHGHGIVIGETTEIGDHCVMYHNVTLGGTGKHKDKRHPTIGNNVLLGTGAVLLGPIKVEDNTKIGAATTIINRDVPGNCTVVGIPGRIVRKDGIRTSEELPLAHYHHRNER